MKPLPTILTSVFSLILLLALPVAHGNTIQATQDGPIGDPATWGGHPLPTPGNTDTWDTNGYNMNFGSVDFHGGHLLVKDGSVLTANAGADAKFRATTFDNGVIRKPTNIASTLDFSGQQLTFESGGTLFTSNHERRNIILDNAVWAGSGPITFRGLLENDGAPSRLILGSGNTLSGYTGVISVENLTNEARPVHLRIEADTTGSFGVNLDSNAQLDLQGADSFIFSFLVLDGEAIAAGTYEYSDLTPAQQAFFVPGSNPGQIEVLPQPEFPTPAIPDEMTFSQPSRNTAHRIKGPHFVADVDVENPQELLKVASSNGEEIYTLSGIRLVQDGKTYESNFSEFTPRMHILRSGAYFNEIHIQNIVLTVPGEGIHWPGLVEYTITFYEDKIYHLVTFKANDNIVIMTPIIGRSEGIGRRGYVAREGFTDCPEVSPASLELLLEYGAPVSNVPATGEAIYVDNLNTVSLPTWPQSVSKQLVDGEVLALQNEDFNVPWNPGRREQIGLLTAFGNRSDLEILIDLEGDPLTSNEITGDGFLGFNPRNGLYQFTRTLIANSFTPRINPLEFLNNEKPRLIFIEHETRGAISAGLVLDESQTPLPLVTQQSLNFPNYVGTEPDRVRETGNSTKIFPVVLREWEQKNCTLLLYGALFSQSDTLRATTWLNTLSQGRGSPILQTSLSNNENTTFRFDGSTHITDFRPHPLNRVDDDDEVARSAHSATNFYFEYYDTSGGRVGLKTTDIRMLHTGPFFSEFEADVESEDSALKGVLRVTIPGTGDHNRVIYELSLEAVENVAVSTDNDTPLTFFRLHRPGPPINYRNYAFLESDGSIVSGTLSQNSDTIHENQARVATNGFMAMYNASNIIRNDLTASQVAGNPMFFIQDWDVAINGQTVSPGAFVYTERRPNDTWGSRGVALKTFEPISNIQKGSTIRYRVVAFTGGDENTRPEDAMSERAAWKDGFRSSVITGSAEEHYYPRFNARNGVLHAVLEGGKDWVPVKVSGFRPGMTISGTVTDAEGVTRDLSSDMPLDVWYSAWSDDEDGKGIAFTVPMMDSDSIVLKIHQNLAFNFNDGSMEGWTAAAIDDGERQYFAVVPPDLNSPHTEPHSGEHFIGLHVPAYSSAEPVYTPDSPHGTLVLRSPEFVLNGSGDLSVWLLGGGAGSAGVAGTAVDDLPAASATGGFLGIALHDVTTGTYVLSAGRTSDGDEWEQVIMDASELASLPQDHVYTLDLIDIAHGDWGWVNMDTVTIPGAFPDEEPASPPTISAIADQTIPVNTNTNALSFTVGSERVDPETMTISGFSSNVTLVPDANIVFGGSGADRTVTITPAADQTGSTTITVTVDDGEENASTGFALTVISDADPTTFEFDEGEPDGWTKISTDAEGRQFFAVVPPSLNSPNEDPHSGSHFIGLHVPAFSSDEPMYTQDSPHDTLVFRSPEFTLNGSGALTAWLSGGGAGSPGLAGTVVDAVPSASEDGGFRGIALRDVTTGTYVLSASKTSDGNEWEQVAFSASELASLPQDHVYTLDLIDAGHGGWGWVNMDTVTIPGALVHEPGVPEMPILLIRRSGQNEVRLSWPAAATGLTLQSAPDVGGEYTDVGLEVTVEGDENVVYDAILSEKQFYRLIE